jgi:hypothetical protein
MAGQAKIVVTGEVEDLFVPHNTGPSRHSPYFGHGSIELAGPKLFELCAPRGMQFEIDAHIRAPKSSWNKKYHGEGRAVKWVERPEDTSLGVVDRGRNLTRR